MQSCKLVTAMLSCVVTGASCFESLCLLLMCSYKEEAEIEALLLSEFSSKAGALPRPKLEELSASWNKAGVPPRSCRLEELTAVPCLSLQVLVFSCCPRKGCKLVVASTLP